MTRIRIVSGCCVQTDDSPDRLRRILALLLKGDSLHQRQLESDKEETRPVTGRNCVRKRAVF